MWSRRLAGLLVTLPLLAASAAHGACPGTDEAAMEWLQKMVHSVHSASYQGVVTLQRNGEMQIMHVSHQVQGDASSERLTQLTGQGAQVDRASHPISCVHPGQKLLEIGRDLEAGYCGIAERYRFSMDGRERIAGRSAVRIRVEPRDVYRFGYLMSLDRETGLLLKAETLGKGDAVLEKFQFANLDYGAGSPAVTDVDVVHQAQHPSPVQDFRGSALGQAWTVQWLPGGFSATDAPPGVAARRTYTDGLAVFSVFLEELERELRPGEGHVRSGGTTTYTRGMRLGGLPVLVTVIGEVPLNTARMVADSIIWVP